MLHAGDYDSQILRETPEFRAIYATRNAKLTLESGVTTIRDLGNEGAGFADIALRDAIAQGLVPGPRIIAAIRPATKIVILTGSAEEEHMQTAQRIGACGYILKGVSARELVRTLHAVTNGTNFWPAILC